MKRAQIVVALVCWSGLVACGEEQEDAAPGATEAVQALRADIATLSKRAEHDAERVKVQHILIGFEGAMRSRATRSQAEAEQTVAGLLTELRGEGVDFAARMRELSEDSGPGEYGIAIDSARSSPKYPPRMGSAEGLAAVAWRLEVGEIGVAGYHPQKSPFGWHIVKRVE